MKLGVADGENLVDDEDFRIQMRRDRKSKARVHAAGITLHRRIDESLDAGEIDDLVKLAGDLRAAHAENGAVEEHVFPAAEFGVKARANLKQACRCGHSGVLRRSSAR